MNRSPLHKNLLLLTGVLFFSCGFYACGKKNAVRQLDPAPGSSIVFIGNSFAERLQDHNYFETLLYKSFPGRKLRVRNLAWSADEVNLRPRPMNFGTLDQHLEQQDAGVIFACFGLNEAFKGPDSLDSFKRDLEGLLAHMQQQQYDGKAAPQLILVSPVAHEALGGFLPDPAGHNENLELYTEGMKEVAGKLDIPFIDLYQPTLKLAAGPDSITTNGIHLNDRGYREVSSIMAAALGLEEPEWTGDEHSRRLREAVATKNQHFFYRFKAQNGEYIYGRRRDWAGGQTLPGEGEEIDRIVSRLDSAIWEGSAAGTSPDMEHIREIVAVSREMDPASGKPAGGVEGVGTEAAGEATVRAAKQDLEKAKSSFNLPEGYEVELFASEVDFPIANPVSITFDARGRMWVASMPSYPHYFPGSPPNDRLVILEDTDHDGAADKHTVFADSLYLPLGFELGQGGVYLTQAPDLVFLKDTDGDDKADSRQTLLSGFGTEDAHHTLSAYTWGPDGALYIHMGTFLHSQVETPYGPRRGAYGTTWRYEPRTMKLEPYISYPYANPWGNVFTKDGTHIIADVSTGMNYFAPPLTVAIDYPKKHTGMKDFLTTSVKPKTCGVEVIASRAFPENVQGNVLFNTFIGFQGVRQHAARKEGSGIIADEIEPLLQSRDPNFRPVDLKFGPDGALYVVDWYDPIIQHGEQGFRDPLRDHKRGRIWRISYKGMPSLEVVDLTKLSTIELLDRLKIYENRERYRVRSRLSELPATEVLPAVEEWLNGLDAEDPEYEQHQLEALWVYQQFNEPQEELLNRLLEAADPYVRTAAARVLYYWSHAIDDAEEKLIALAVDPSPAVRLQAITSLSHFESEAAVKGLLAATGLPADDYINYALSESFKHLRPVWVDMFRKDKDFLSGEPEKAFALFRPLASAAELQVPGFIRDDPNYKRYEVAPLSGADLEVLSGAAAFEKFHEENAALFAKPAAEEPPAEEPGGMAEGSATEMGEVIIELASLPGKMLFDKDTLQVPAGKTVSLVFDNRDQMPHNVVIVASGAAEKVGEAADNMAVSEDGYERNFVPDLPEVLFSTPLIPASQKFQLNFTAPEEPGDYPFICTFPGHWRMMRGIIKVTGE